MRRLLQGHLDQRTPGEAAGPVEGVDDVERSQRRLQERHPETTFGTVQVARPGGWRSSMAPRRSSTARAPPSTLRCGNRSHPRGRVRPARRCLCSHRHRRHRRGVRYLVRDRDGVHWCTLVLPSTAVSSMRGSGSAGWPTWVGAEAVLKLRVLRSQPRPRCVLGLPRHGSTSGAPRPAIR